MENNEPQEIEKEQTIEFKKPVLVGRVGKLSKRAKIQEEKTPATDKTDEKPIESPKDSKSQDSAKKSLPPAVLVKELSTPIPYKEPKWSGLCPEGSNYALEVLKSGTIVENVDLTNKPYYVFGRLANSDIVMAHPTISRHHSVLQYKAFAEENEPPCGWYLFDLGSTHGTFLNKDRLKASHYTRVKVGHQIKFGNSTRTYIVLGPSFDCEGESELSVTEMKQKTMEMKAERDRMIKEAIEKRETERLEEEKKREEQGIDWGMGEDAEEETDLTDNPYAATSNEELYLTDPKKTLRGYFEREGHELKYNCEERGPGTFVCSVELPLEESGGGPSVAQVVHRGKKKEAVVACALEACRLLDRAGLLRQAKHESRRRKERDWSADDYYDSDEDTFLDRTGAVERKRQIRMEKHGAVEVKNDKPLTYDDLLKQTEELESKIKAEENSLERLRTSLKSNTQASTGDDLDEYMLTLTHGTMSQKAEISQTKMNIQKLKSELSKTQRLADIARPAHLPPLVKKDDKKPTVKIEKNVVYGKRIRLKDDAIKKPKNIPQKKQDESEFVEEVDSDEESLSEAKAISKTDKNTDVKNEEKPDSEDDKSVDSVNSAEKNIRHFGPMRPPENYVVPEGYFNSTSERDCNEVMEE